MWGPDAVYSGREQRLESANCCAESPLYAAACTELHVEGGEKMNRSRVVLGRTPECIIGVRYVCCFRSIPSVLGEHRCSFLASPSRLPAMLDKSESLAGFPLGPVTHTPKAARAETQLAPPLRAARVPSGILLPLRAASSTRPQLAYAN